MGTYNFGEEAEEEGEEEGEEEEEEKTLLLFKLLRKLIVFCLMEKGEMKSPLINLGKL